MFLEFLEVRQTPAVTFTHVAGHLTISGDDTNNTFDVSLSSDKFFIIRFGTNVPSVKTTAALKTTTQITVEGNGGNDSISLAPLVASALTNQISIQGGAGNDTLVGSGKADKIDGGEGNDSLFGGPGNDTVFGAAGDDSLTGAKGNDFISGGFDIDTVLESGNVNFTLHTALGGPSLDAGVLGFDAIFSIEMARLVGGPGNNVLDADTFLGAAFLDGLGGNDTLVGGFASSTLNGGTGNDSLVGGISDDTLNGGTGNDTLRGNGRDDLLIGSLGKDLIDGGSDTDRLSEVIASTTAKTLTLTNTSFRLKDSSRDETDSLLSIEEANIRTNSGNNKLIAAGFDGDATLTGGAGNDTLIGGEGNDLLDGAGGTDRVELSTLLNATLTNTSLTDAVSSDTLSSIESAAIRSLIGMGVPNRFDATGFSFPVELHGDFGNDTLLGGSGPDVLDGGPGNDRLEGNDGNDALDGGPGVDTVLGGNGNDSAPFDNADFVDLGPGEDGFVVNGTDGDDVIVIRRQVGPDGAEAVVEINGTTFVMNYIQGETVFVLGGKGNDVIAMDASAGDFWKAHFLGEDGNDTLVGRGRADYLDGGDGNDTLYGGDGDDVLIGGRGVDWLSGDGGFDLLISLDGSWVDRVFADGDDIWHRDAIDRLGH